MPALARVLVECQGAQVGTRHLVLLHLRLVELHARLVVVLSATGPHSVAFAVAVAHLTSAADGPPKFCLVARNIQFNLAPAYIAACITVQATANLVEEATALFCLQLGCWTAGVVLETAAHSLATPPLVQISAGTVVAPPARRPMSVARRRGQAATGDATAMVVICRRGRVTTAIATAPTTGVAPALFLLMVMAGDATPTTGVALGLGIRGDVAPTTGIDLGLGMVMAGEAAPTTGVAPSFRMAGDATATATTVVVGPHTAAEAALVTSTPPATAPTLIVMGTAVAHPAAYIPRAVDRNPGPEILRLVTATVVAVAAAVAPQAVAAVWWDLLPVKFLTPLLT